ncbi:GNAT family N-acetyltransferase [Alistipes sp.]|uniref:GNAT family N-acetyltransferase n=1 Tax=Alistipes sp. TaxID=1872444 RepID=UPI003AEF840D
MIRIETPRLVLRSWHDDDLPAFAAMNADPRVMEFFPSPLTHAESAAFLRRLREESAAEGFGVYAVERRSDGEFLGLTGLHRVTFSGPLHNQVEIGWRLRAEAWGQGYASEAARACLDRTAERGIGTVVAFTALGNLRSQRVMQRLGMKRVGEFDHPALPAGHPLLRHVLYRIGLDK